MGARPQAPSCGPSPPALQPPGGWASASAGDAQLCLHPSPEAFFFFLWSRVALTSPPPEPRHKRGPPCLTSAPKPLLPVLPQVVCARCSDYRAELKYDDNRPSRVCLDCYTFLTGNVLPEDKEDKRRGILEVRAGFLY